jgi:hypothetical protein
MLTFTIALVSVVISSPDAFSIACAQVRAHDAQRNKVTGAPVNANKKEVVNGASELTAGLGRSDTACSVLGLDDTDHRREVGHRLPSTDGNVFRRQFV